MSPVCVVILCIENPTYIYNNLKAGVRFCYTGYMNRKPRFIPVGTKPNVVTWIDQFTLNDTDLMKKIQRSKKLKVKKKT